ncbi:uncharacterized protein L969DRAFT_92454 [Mixia osmundae IAM 14324]|uniref:Chromosome transmission fidelity protein 8 n=1 Tax=Mixia osmundae (strain CBS 9802 / IAM 14324 / JCM 22182 / KY 12970) TaxID=764103 RepID=G7DXH7_MIXOS|nr:uncharacterized protein L969DRAFT_92454 [Mixia osmundae IAM 14324]KEI41219.1 hypothetical protein L969DRAFT_92454 [Mixia osmundae IAM 14324]GAA95287.1 hypothetical protein E5Q_01943 [Mixia osmundae IAM 14324]
MRLPLSISLDHQSDPKAPFTLQADTGEIFLIEMQGTLETEVDDELVNDPTLRDGQKIGTLDLSDPARPSLLIGHHRLVGSFANLERPLAILRHTIPPSDPDSDDGLDPQGERASKKRKTADGDFEPTAVVATSSSPETFRKVVDQTPLRDNKLRSIIQPSSSAQRTPATPFTVSELKRGKHEIVGMLYRRILFTKRPEPVLIASP